MIYVIRILLMAIVLLPMKCAAIDVLVNQVGFEPDSPKVFRAQRSTDYSGDGTFSIRRVGDGGEVHSGTLTRKGGLWDKYYWEGDFSSLKTQGNYYIAATVGTESINSYSFTIAPGTLLSQTGTLVYQYFNTQRCGVNVPGWHGPCHLDDGIRSDNNQHMDAVGGWHDAGDYNKFPHGFAGDGVFALLWLYDNNRSYYDAIDTDSNSIPDIVDEALFQARWLAKMVDSNGHVLRQTRMHRSGATWVKPENDTDNVVGSYDDRWIDPGDENTPQETVVCAALIRMHRLLAAKGLPTENFANKALAIWDHKVAVAQSQGGHNNLGSAAHLIFAGLDLYTVFDQQNCWDRALQCVQETADNTISNPARYDSINAAEWAGYELGALAWFARTYPSAYCANSARSAVQALMSHNIYLANDPIGLIRRDDGGTLQYFETNTDWNGYFIGINRLYLLLTWGAIQAYKTVGDSSYLRFAVDQYNWVMGANYNRVCMMEAVGDYNLARYHTRYDTLSGHSSGKQPGCVPNGYIRVYSTGLPNIDLTTNRWQSNEGWLINNAAYAMAISEVSLLSDMTTPGPVTNFTASPDDGQVVLSWRNPDDPDLTAVMIRVSTTAFPTSPTDGMLVVNKTVWPGTNDSYPVTDLTNTITYYFSVFAHDAVPNYAAAAHASGTPNGLLCFNEQFSYPSGSLNGKGLWSGSADTQISVENQSVRISGGPSSVYVARIVNCTDGGTGAIGVAAKVKKGSGVTSFWNLWIDDMIGSNLARWYGTGTSVRGRVGTYSPGSVVNLTGGWDDLYIKINCPTKESTFVFNGTPIGTFSYSGTGALDMVGRIRIERIQTTFYLDDHVFLDNVTVGVADSSSPTASVGPPSAIVSRTGPIHYTVTFSEPVYGFRLASDIQLNKTGTANAGSVVISGTGAGPYTVTLSNLTGDGTLGISVKAGACSDVAGNTNTAGSPSETVIVLGSDGSIAASKLLPDNTPVSLGNKALYLKQAGFGYIEEPDRSSGIRIEGSISASEGDLVCLTGTMKTTFRGECFIQIIAMSPCGTDIVRPLGVINRAISMPQLTGLYVRVWGEVKAGSISPNSYILTDGSDLAGLMIVTQGAPGVIPGQFVTPGGAAGYESRRVIYQR